MSITGFRRRERLKKQAVVEIIEIIEQAEPVEQPKKKPKVKDDADD